MANSTIAVSFTTTTLLGSHLGLSNLLPVAYNPQREFTLNNHLNIAPNESIGNNLPKLRYFGVGIRGGYNTDDGILFSCYNPSRSNMNLYTLIPIRCVPVDEDLSTAERALYRLRQRKTINGTDYYLYYLKCLTFSESIKYKRVSVDNSEEEYELNSSFLTPTPSKAVTDGTLETKGSILAYCQAKIDLTASEVLEYIRAAYAGDTRYARISEIGFFTGVDKVITGTNSQNTQFQYTEAIDTQLHTHCTIGGITMSTEGMNLSTVVNITSSGISVD